MESYRLPDILLQRRWRVYARPFWHVIAQDVFTPAFYQRLDQAFGAMLARGISEGQTPFHFSRNIRNYDAYSIPFGDGVPAPLDIFFSRPWHDLLAGIAGVPASGDVNGGFHHHRPGSASGEVHNDLNPGWFLNAADPGAVNLSNEDLCSYTSGRVSDPALLAHESVRAIACLLYLHNPDWAPGDGGETGLYSRASQPVTAPDKAVPPRNNSLLMFECRPDSHHAFISNPSGPRNSMIMWLHRHREDAVRQWGADAIVRWSD